MLSERRGEVGDRVTGAHGDMIPLSRLAEPAPAALTPTLMAAHPIVDLLADLVDPASASIDDCIHQALGRVGAWLGAHQSAVWQHPDGLGSLAISHQWIRADGGESRVPAVVPVTT